MLLWNIFLILILLYQCFGDDDLLSKFVQHDYKVKDIRGEVAYYDTDYFREFKIRTFKHNRTTVAINLSYVSQIDMEDKQEALVQGYKFLSNEFRPIAVRFQLSLYKFYKANVVGLHKATSKCGFFNDSYVLKDVNYTICNFIVDYSKMPPLIPTGIYKIEITYIYLNHNFAIANYYGEIYRQIYPPKEKKVKPH